MFLPPFRATPPEAPPPASVHDAIAAAQQALDPSFSGPSRDLHIPSAYKLNIQQASATDTSAASAPHPLKPATGRSSPTFAQSAQQKPPSQLNAFSPSTQEILRRLGHNISSESPEWEAARKQVVQSMAATPSTSSPRTSVDLTQATKRGRGRGRPPNSIRLSVDGVTSRNSTSSRPAISSSLATDAISRGRGRGGRPRGTAGIGRGSQRKRKRTKSGNGEDDTDDNDDGDRGSSSMPPSDSHPSTPKAPTVTKSGRSVQKPSTFLTSPTTTPSAALDAANTTPRGVTYSRVSHRGRGGRKSTAKTSALALCAKCLRGHSPESNVIVFCDGCNTPWHQWCHVPHIGREVVEVPDKAWFCSRCEARREEVSVPMESRVSGVRWTAKERQQYLEGCGTEMLRALLGRVLDVHPDAPIFPPPAHASSNPSDVAMDKNRPEGTATSSALTPLSGNTPASTAPSSHAPRETSNQYPDILAAAATNDPPSTYPRPGHGPITPRSTTGAEDVQWLLDDEGGFGVFSHFYDGTDAPNYGERGASGPLNSGQGEALNVNGLMSVAGTGEPGVKGSWIKHRGSVAS